MEKNLIVSPDASVAPTVESLQAQLQALLAISMSNAQATNTLLTTRAARVARANAEPVSEFERVRTALNMQARGNRNAVLRALIARGVSDNIAVREIAAAAALSVPDAENALGHVSFLFRKFPLAGYTVSIGGSGDTATCEFTAREAAPAAPVEAAPAAPVEAAPAAPAAPVEAAPTEAPSTIAASN